MITKEQYNQFLIPSLLISIPDTAKLYLGDDLLSFPGTPSVEFLTELGAELSRNVQPADNPAFVDFIAEVHGFCLLTSDEAVDRVYEFTSRYQGWFDSERAFVEYCYNYGMYPFHFGADKLLPRDCINFDAMTRFMFQGDFTRTSRGYVFRIF